MKIKYLIIVLGVLNFTSLYSQTKQWREVQYFQNPEGAWQVKWGGPISISENNVLIGNCWDNCDDSGLNPIPAAGSSSFYIQDSLSGDWIKHGPKLLSDFRIEGDWFGYRVGLDSNYAVVGSLAGFSDGIDTSNCLFIYKKNISNSWILWQKISYSGDPRSTAAFDVSIRGKYILSGRAFPDHTGRMTIYKLDTLNDQWNQQAEFTSPDGMEDISFGSGVSISENFAFVHDPFLQKVYIYKKTNSSWEYFKTIDYQGDRGLEPSMQSRSDLLLIGGQLPTLSSCSDLLLVSASTYTKGNQGHVLLYKFDTINDDWVFKKEFSAPSNIPEDDKENFGRAIFINANSIIIGCPSVDSCAPGYVFLYEKDLLGWEETPIQLFGAEQTLGDGYGSYLASNGNTIFVSSFGDGLGWGYGNTFRTDGGFYVYKPCDSLIINAGFDHVICLGDSVILGGDTAQPTAQGGVKEYEYVWTTIPPSTFRIKQENPIVSPGITTKYLLTVQDYNGLGLIATDTITIYVDSVCSCEFPYLITTNGHSSPIDFSSDNLDNLFSIVKYDRDSVFTPFCTDPSWRFDYPADKYYIYSCDYNGIKKGLSGFATHITDPSLQPIIISSDRNVYIAVTSDDSLHFSDGSKYGNPSSSASIKLFARDLMGNIGWKQSFWATKRPVANCDITQNQNKIFLAGTAYSGTQINTRNGLFTMPSNGVFIAVINKADGLVDFATAISSTSLTSKPSICYYYVPTLNKNLLLINLSGTIKIFDLQTSLSTQSVIYSSTTKDKIIVGQNMFYIKDRSTIRGLTYTNNSIQSRWVYSSLNGEIVDFEPYKKELFFSYSIPSTNNAEVGILDEKGIKLESTWQTERPMLFSISSDYSFAKAHGIKYVDSSSVYIGGFYIPFNSLNCHTLIIDAGPDIITPQCQSVMIGGHPVSTGGSGNYSILWTSIPLGFYSDEENPVVNPQIDTYYILTVTDLEHNLCKADTVLVSINTNNWPQRIYGHYIFPFPMITCDSVGNVTVWAHYDEDTVYFSDHSSIIHYGIESKYVIASYTKDGCLRWKNSIKGSIRPYFRNATDHENNYYGLFISFGSPYMPSFYSYLNGPSDTIPGSINAYYVSKILNNGVIAWNFGIYCDKLICPEAEVVDICSYKDNIYITGYCCQNTVFGDSIIPWEGNFICKINKNDSRIVYIKRIDKEESKGFGIITSLNDGRFFVIFKETFYLMNEDGDILKEYTFNDQPGNADKLYFDSPNRLFYVHQGNVGIDNKIISFEYDGVDLNYLGESHGMSYITKSFMAQKSIFVSESKSYVCSDVCQKYSETGDTIWSHYFPKQSVITGIGSMNRGYVFSKPNCDEPTDSLPYVKIGLFPLDDGLNKSYSNNKSDEFIFPTPFISSETEKIYPNPTSKNLTIEISTPISSEEYVEIFNSQGLLLGKEYLHYGKNDIVMESFPKGVYLIMLKNSQRRSVKKIVKL